MLIVAKELKELDFSQLMEVYAEGNLENGAELYPEEPQGRQIALAEQDFYSYLRESFFPAEGAVYLVWQAGGRYVSALRLEPWRDGLLLEALETKPGERKKGYAAALLRAALEICGDRKIYSHVGKGNIASLRTHESCGFKRTLEYAVHLDGSVLRNLCTLRYEKTLEK